MSLAGRTLVALSGHPESLCCSYHSHFRTKPKANCRYRGQTGVRPQTLLQLPSDSCPGCRWQLGYIFQPGVALHRCHVHFSAATTFVVTQYLDVVLRAWLKPLANPILVV